MLLLLACTAPDSPGAAAPDPARVAGSSLGSGFTSVGGRWRASGRGWDVALDDGAELRMRRADLTLGSAGTWTRSGARIEQVDGPVTTWWQVGAVGLELGFTLAAPAVVDFPVRGATVEQGDEGDIVLRAPDGWVHLSGLVARDATGAEVPVTMEPTGEGIRFTVEASRYPVEIDPLVSGDWAVAEAANSLLTFDHDLDGYGDIFVGSALTSFSSTDSEEGQVQLYPGGKDGPPTSPTWTFDGTAVEGRAGVSMGKGDFDGDAYLDLVVGIPGDDSGRGAAMIFRGTPRGFTGAPDRLEGTIPKGTFGRGFVTADVNRDGFDDLFVAASGPFGVWLHEGGPHGLDPVASWYLELPDLTDAPPALAVGDLDADGWPDLAVGMDELDSDPDQLGQVWVLYGRRTGLGSSPDVLLAGWEDHGHCGDGLGMGDWNADGYDDLAVGCPEVDDYFSMVGKVEVYYGGRAPIPTTPDWSVRGDEDSHGLGGNILDDGDLDGDGYHEMLVGGTGAGLEGPGRINVYAGTAAGLEAEPRWWWAGSGEGWVATSASGASDVDGDGYDDLALGSGRIDQDGRTWLLPGGPEGAAAEAPGWRATEDNIEIACVAAVPDVDGDGLDELVLGSPDDGLGVGHAWFYEGRPEGVGQGYWFLLSDATGNAFGTAITPGGDIDGDGIDDLVVGAPEADDSFVDEGRIEVYGGTGTELSAIASSTVWGGADGAALGSVLLGPGDTDGDGYADVLAGQPGWSGSHTGEGRVLLYGGSASGLVDPPLVSIEGGQEGAALGTTLASAGDVNGDGRQDVLLGSPGWDETALDEGRVELWLGDGRGLELLPAWTVYGGAEGAEAGYVAGGGDADGDGVIDVLVGLPGLDEVSLYTDFGTSPTWTLTGPGNDARFAAALAFVGDVDADGDDDFVVGAPAYNDDEGAAWLYTGEPGGASDVAAMSWRGGWPGGCFSCSVSGAMELNGDGYGDFAIASPGLGLVEVWYGGPLDGDGDGYESDTDCDDTEPGTHPGALESEDGVDEDCDGLVDNPATWYRDLDGDGFGDAEDSETSFSAPTDYVRDARDCDDDDPNTHPGATERCDGLDQDCNGVPDDEAWDATPWYTDNDGDGVTGTWVVLGCTGPDGSDADGSDCDDDDATVYPGALEACDGLDNDCSGILDDEAPEDAVLYYPDADGDGYGADDAGTPACGAPAGWVTVGGDCDDAGDAVNPAAVEVCNGLDDDCDGDTDGDAVDALTAYADTDGDGHGDPASALSTCSIPIGWVRDPDDCDDTDGDVAPGARETCDGVDEDCDGAIDNGASDGNNYYLDRDHDGHGSTEYVRDCGMPEGYVTNDDDCDDYDPAILGPVVWRRDADLDGYGNAEEAIQSCTGPAGYTANDEDCDDTRNYVHPGAPEKCDGVDDDCNGGVDDDPIDAGTWYTDADGDGHGDPEIGTVSCDQPEGTSESPDDCDDGDATIGAPAWMYQDADADGYGDSTVSTVLCPGDPNWVIDATDCDDTRADVHPNADETCDGVDEDCDTAIDESPLDGSIWYADADGDGYGDYDVATYGCSGDTLDATDCDDGAATVHPGATEVWYDGVDQDCDGNDDDRDGDGSPFGADCDDHDPTVGADCPGGTPDTGKAEPQAPSRCSGCTSGVSSPGIVALLACAALLRRRVWGPPAG